ncbi:RadC family protein [Desulfobacter latus]|uniref:DNA repair protein RadC n=1 Tax=Desulfobacter latus TaxID=2292 RepID=A0A850T9J8_9BACT|nr:DNA repair protein RadC [Desulfobacter latus]NWH04036.1 DNA repair protein RadC [Desulfobacter latus]
MSRKRIHNLLPEDRPREKLLAKGPGFLKDKELLAILLGKGTKDQDVLALAEKLIPVIDKKGLCLTADDLTSFKGVGTAKAATILSAIEFSRRRIKPEGYKIKSPEDLFPHIRQYADRKQEYFLCTSINGANEIMNIRVVSIGLVNSTQVHPREVFANPLMDRASAVIFAHNHPSGDLTPSNNDIQITMQLMEAGKILGIRVLDHLIFNQKEYFSFQERSVVDGLK